MIFVDETAATIEAFDVWLASLPYEVLVLLRQRTGRRFLPKALDRLRREQRDGLIRELASLGVGPRVASGAEMAAILHKELLRVANGAGQFELDGAPPADHRRAVVLRVIRLSGRRAPGLRTIWNALAAIENRKPKHETVSDVLCKPPGSEKDRTDANQPPAPAAHPGNARRHQARDRGRSG